ncbi:MAG: MFS transporter [Chloroflexi bacterium]|nr:MFS transporter [Chloroflexota bacterium]
MTGTRSSSKWLGLVAVGFGVFQGTMDAGMINISFPRLSEALDVSPATVVWVQAVFLLVSTGLLLTVGRLGDVWGRKRFYITGFALFTLGLALSAASQNIYQLIGFRAVTAVGQALMTANSSAIITAIFPPQERGRAFGVMEGVVVGLGLSSGPLLGGFLLDMLGWRSIFYARVPVALVGIVLAWRLLREERHPGRAVKLDPAGAVTSFLVLAGLLLWLNQGARIGWANPTLATLLVGVGACAVTFVVIEFKVKAPVLDLRLFRYRNLSLTMMAHVLQFIAWATLTFMLPFYLIRGLGLSASQAGMVATLSPAVRIAVGPFSGLLSERFGTRPLAVMGLATMAAGLYVMAQLGADTPLLIVVAPFLLVSFGFAVFEPPNSSAIMGAVPRERLGMGSALIGTARQTGMSTGIALAGSLFAARQVVHASRLSPGQPITAEAVVLGYQDTLLLAMAAALLGMMASFLTRGQRARQKTVELHPEPS